jgi:predicted DNA-binding protein (UPF0251 family)
VLARLCEGHSQREAAELCDISKTYVVLLTSSALSKITKAGLSLNIPKYDGAAPQIIPVDPRILNNRTAT